MIVAPLLYAAIGKIAHGITSNLLTLSCRRRTERTPQGAFGCTRRRRPRLARAAWRPRNMVPRALPRRPSLDRFSDPTFEPMRAAL
jgi:hypothetical protein